MTARVIVPAGLLTTLRSTLSSATTSPSQITTLHCFDFDGTLIRTPGLVEGKALYYKHTGRPWPYRGWWGRLESLKPPIVPDPFPASMFIDDVYTKWRRVRAGLVDGAVGFVATGRRSVFREQVVKILGSCNDWTGENGGDEVEKMRLGDGWEKGVCCFSGAGKMSVDEWKMGLVVEVVKQLGDVRIVYMWEDRAEHAKVFEDVLGKRLRGIGVRLIVNRVIAT
eukprot:Plantae.Rhodophyta-Hildenbrandia_rubra.ctg1223.p1 GENE.Plantae.Rhodophyta-Hildenbrandia_rubra.ctg1223~~Plantae.Rhodophyta-Hildenbrandia_rubra.ctg1223.p1  ORF type:complete len:224 (-),score=36.51 Plantae.Rhodophyta-Hildenbrandia_rubra.ctg1223:753-1424(-)